MHIAIITWWKNSEREISLLSAQAVKTWIESLWYTSPIQYDFPKDTSTFVSDHTQYPYDFVFLMIHGAWGEDGQIASFLDLLDIPYQCTSPDILALTMNKWHTKLVRRAHNIPVAEDICIVPVETTQQDLQKKIQTTIWFPCVRKELDQWSSNWVCIMHQESDFTAVRKRYSSFSHPILIEQFIVWEEITIPLLDTLTTGTQALPVIHIIPPKTWWFDYENKYNGKTQELCPSWFSEETIQHIHSIALKAYKAVQCTKYARIDAILTDKWPVLLEINTIPWFTAQSLFPKSAQVQGIAFPDLLKHLIQVSQKSI
jgi:D-alanine-D-alanine ligase